MIIGSGFLARSFGPRFGDRTDVMLFASGVSNSLETRLQAFAREKNLLQQQQAQRSTQLVYFSSCGVVENTGQTTPYMHHKREMEALVLAMPRGLVVRLPQVVGSTPNPHTLTNYLRDRILSGERFSVWAKAERNLLDVVDLVAIASAVIDDGDLEERLVSIASGEILPMPDIVRIFEHVLERRAHFVLEDKGAPLVVDNRMALRLGSRLGIDLGHGYSERVVRKYYAPDK